MTSYETKRRCHFSRAAHDQKQAALCGDCDTHLPRMIRALLLLLAVAGTLSAIGCAKKVSVPSVVQMDLEQAKAMLAAVPLKPGAINCGPGARWTEAYVLSQTPIPVPNLVNTNVTDAVNMLQGVGLKVMLMKKPSSNIFGKTKVVQQDPPPSTLVRHDASVMLTVTAPPDVGVHREHHRSIMAHQ